MIRFKPILVCIVGVLALTQMSVCVAHRVRNPQPTPYLQTVLDDELIGPWDEAAIRSLVAQGIIGRIRSDAGTVEAR